MKLLIGLTGNIATGKSTVARMLADLGATVVDADRVAHEVMRAGTPVHAAVVEAFGPEILRPDGEIDRARLGAIVFSDPAALARLEAIVHPAVGEEVARRIAVAPTSVVVVEAIKLIESGMARICRAVWVTTCPFEEQVRRLMADRGLSREEAERRIRAQPPQEEKIARADVVIRTDTTLEETRAQVERAWRALVKEGSAIKADETSNTPTGEERLMRTEDYIRLEETYGAHNYRPIDVVITRAEGVWVWDVEGNRYLDCLSAYSAVNQGHCHPRILQALVEQAQRVTLTSRAFRNDQLPLLAKELCELTGYDMMLPMNSGAEAVETAIKAARKWGYTVKGVPPDRAEIIVCAGNFHGRTITIVGFSTEPKYREGFGPFTPGFVIIPYGDAAALEAAITPNTVAFLVEPVQGEGGVVVPPEGYLRAVREICSRHNVLFIADEIQTGLGRTGRLFACDWENVRPDALIVGKALSGGFYPVSAVLASREVLGVFRPGDHGSTFGGNPLACAVARAALRVIVEENLPAGGGTGPLLPGAALPNRERIR